MLAGARATDMLGLDRKNLVAVTMPCFGTTRRTKSNAMLLAETWRGNESGGYKQICHAAFRGYRPQL
jgi:hypothetical protein